MKALLIVKCAVEVLAGLAFVLLPGAMFALLLGATLDAPGTYAFRMFGTAVFAIGLACWLARDDSESAAARALIVALLIYDFAFAAILLAADFGAGLSGIALWPVVTLHSALGIYSLLCLRKGPAPVHTG